MQPRCPTRVGHWGCASYWFQEVSKQVSKTKTYKFIGFLGKTFRYSASSG